MTLSLRAGFALLATTAVLAGCSTAPTITMPNPLAALNGVFTPAPRVAAAPTYTAAPGRYEPVGPSYTAASYGTIDQGYSLPSVDTGTYALGDVASSYSAASSFDQGTYTLGSVASAPAAASYSSGVPTFGTLAAEVPSYSMAEPMMETASYASTMPMPMPMLGGSSAMAVPMPSYTQSYGAATMAAPVSSYTRSYGSAQPVRASGTTYDLTGSSMTDSMGMTDPAAGLIVDTVDSTYAEPSVPMGGSFQVFNPGMSTGVATYSTAPAVIDGGTFTY